MTSSEATSKIRKRYTEFKKRHKKRSKHATMASLLSSAAIHVVKPIATALQPFTASNSPFNSHPKAADPACPTDLIWLLDNTAAQDETAPQKWRTSFVAAFFAKGTGETGQRVVSHVISELQKFGYIDKEDGEIRARVEHRVLPFFREVIQDREVDIRLRKSLPGSTDGESIGGPKTIGPSDDDGVARHEISVDGDLDDGSIAHAGVVGDVNYVPAYTTFAAPEGWAVISDIDDTIKVTMTAHHGGILKTTFLDEPVPIKGMPELYWHICRQLGNPPFWYLSASPYNLYEFLHDFRDKHYPRGTIELRNASWQNLIHFVESVNKGTFEYKVNKLEERIFKYWPKRRVVCFGDSTQSDPEVYGEMARRHPEWVKCICIRRVTGVVIPGESVEKDKGEKERNSDERFKKAFEGVDEEICLVFDEPEEVYPHIDKVTKEG